MKGRVYACTERTDGRFMIVIGAPRGVQHVGVSDQPIPEGKDAIVENGKAQAA